MLRKNISCCWKSCTTLKYYFINLSRNTSNKLAHRVLSNTHSRSTNGTIFNSKYYLPYNRCVRWTFTQSEKKFVFVSFYYVNYQIFNTIGSETLRFYSASALLAMQSAVLARGIPSVRLSVCLSVTFRYCVQTNEDTIVRFEASGRTIPLVSGEVKFIQIFAGNHPQRGVKVRHPSIDRENSTNNRP